MTEAGVDVLLLSVGSDLPYLTGYEAMPLERLTMLVVPQDAEATLVIPRLEAPRVVEQPGVFSLRPWDETDDPVAIVAGLAATPGVAAVGDTMWARFMVDLLAQRPGARYVRANEVMGELRMRKDAAEIEALRKGGRVARAVADIAAWYRERQLAVNGIDGAPMHDSCAIAPLIDPAFIRYEPVPLAVELAQGLARGMTLVDRRPIQPGARLSSVAAKQPPNVEMAVDVDRPKLIAAIVEAVTSYR